jgi:hypothetical protein
MTLRLLARPALVVATSGQTPKRRERRKILREARVGATGQASECAEQILRHYQLTAKPTGALLSAIGDGLTGGLRASALVERVVACGRLGDARDPLAVITHRTRRVADELASAREDDQRRREAAAAEKRTLAQRRAEEEEASLRFAEESRWLASVLDVLPSGEDLGLAPLLWSRPVRVEASILSTFREVASLWPSLSPGALATRWARSLCARSELDIEGTPANPSSSLSPATPLPRTATSPVPLDRFPQGSDPDLAFHPADPPSSPSVPTGLRVLASSTRIESADRRTSIRSPGQTNPLLITAARPGRAGRHCSSVAAPSREAGADADPDRCSTADRRSKHPTGLRKLHRGQRCHLPTEYLTRQSVNVVEVDDTVAWDAVGVG